MISLSILIIGQHLFWEMLQTFCRLSASEYSIYKSAHSAELRLGVSAVTRFCLW